MLIVVRHKGIQSTYTKVEAQEVDTLGSISKTWLQKASASQDYVSIKKTLNHTILEWPVELHLSLTNLPTGYWIDFKNCT